MEVKDSDFGGRVALVVKVFEPEELFWSIEFEATNFAGRVDSLDGVPAPLKLMILILRALLSCQLHLE